MTDTSAKLSDLRASIDNIDAGFTIGRTIAFGHAEERLARQQA